MNGCIDEWTHAYLLFLVPRKTTCQKTDRESQQNGRPVNPRSGVTFCEYQTYVSETYWKATHIMRKQCARDGYKSHVNVYYWGRRVSSVGNNAIFNIFCLDPDPWEKDIWMSELSGSQLVYNESKSLTIGFQLNAVISRACSPAALLLRCRAPIG